MGSVSKAHESRTKLNYVWLKYLPLLRKSNDSVNVSQEYTDKLIPRGCASFGNKNQHLWEKLKDHLAFSSHSVYSPCMFKTIIELELMCTVKQKPRLSGVLQSNMSHINLVTTDPKCTSSEDKIAVFKGQRASILSVCI